MRDLVLLATWLVAIPVTFFCPAAGICFWIWDALFSPTELAYSFMAGVETNKIVAVATLLSAVMAAGTYRMRLGAIGRLLVALAVVASASAAFPLVSTDASDFIYLKLLKEIVLAIAIIVLITRRDWLYMAMFSVAVALGFLGVKEGLIALLTVGGHHITGSRATGDNNQLAAALVSTLPLMYAIYRLSVVRALRAGSAVAMFLTAFTVVMSFSRGGFVGLVVLALLFLKGSQRRFAGIVVIALAGGLIYLSAPPEWFQRVDTIHGASEDGSFMGRVIAWKLSWLIAADHPFFGGGMHAVQQYVVWHRYARVFSSLDFIPTSIPDLFPHAAHSIYFEVLGDLGFSGLAIYLALMAASLWNCRVVGRMARGRRCSPALGVMAQCLSWAIVCYMVTGAALSIAYYDLFFVLIALTAAARFVAAAEQDEGLAAGAAAARVAVPPAVVRLPTPSKPALPQPVREPVPYPPSSEAWR